MIKCKFCNKKIKRKQICYNFKENKLNGAFYHCDKCKIFFNNKIVKEKIYTRNIKNLNVSNKNLLYYLKTLFLIFFLFKNKKIFFKK